MDNPCECPTCDNWVELRDMKRTDGKLALHNLVCEECYENLESDDEDLEEYDGNAISEVRCVECNRPLRYFEAENHAPYCEECDNK